eukprot:6393414-Amphidinium_carterae.1
MELAAQKATTSQSVSSLEATLRDTLTRNQEACFFAQAENHKARTLENHFEVQLRKELESHEQSQRKNAEWYDKELEAQRKVANERIMAMAVQERAAREQVCKDLETKAQMHQREETLEAQ